MKKIWNWIVEHPNRTMFLIPILLVAGISISHVVSWYNIANPISWAIYLSCAIEIGAMTALVAATNKVKGGVWLMFGLITTIQMIGNIFYSYKQIDSDGELFKSWVELTGPIWETLGSKTTDIISMKRWLAFLEGGLLPIISLTSLHFFTKYDAGKTDNVQIKEVIKEVPVEIEKIVEVPVEVEKSIFDSNTGEIGLSQDELLINNGVFFSSPEEPKFISPEIDTQEPPRPNRLSYVKP